MAKSDILFTIWSNANELRWEDWHDAFDEENDHLSDSEKLELMEELNAEYLDDERRNLDVFVDTPIIVIADIGKWDGRHSAYRIIRDGNIKNCLFSELDGCTWYVDRVGDFRFSGYHHDGCNSYLYRKFRKDVDEEDMDEFGCKILDHNLTQEDIEKYTERLGDAIAKVYGFELPN